MKQAIMKNRSKTPKWARLKLTELTASSHSGLRYEITGNVRGVAGNTSQAVTLKGIWSVLVYIAHILWVGLKKILALTLLIVTLFVMGAISILRAILRSITTGKWKGRVKKLWTNLNSPPTSTRKKTASSRLFTGLNSWLPLLVLDVFAVRGVALAFGVEVWSIFTAGVVVYFTNKAIIRE